MHVEKIFVIKNLAEKLWKTEDSLAQSMSDASTLMAGIMQGRKDLNLSAVVTAKVTDQIAQAIAQMAEAQNTIVAAHAEMDEIKLRLGVRTKLLGWPEKTAPKPGGGGVTDVEDQRQVS